MKTPIAAAHGLLELIGLADIAGHTLEIRAGHAVVREEPGSGVAWNEAAVKQYLYQ